VGIIHQGKVVSLDSPERLKRTMGGAQIVLLSKDDNERRLKGLKIPFKTANEHIYVGVADGSSRDTLGLMIEAGVNLDEMIITKQTLEDVFWALLNSREFLFNH